MGTDNYNDNVFINCPFDDEFEPLLHAYIFTVLDCGFIPRCSRELDDATEFRLSSIVGLIRECRYGIHDLSRVELDKKNNLPRFNMPLELGIFYGAKHFGGSIEKRKQCIILEKNKYRYHKFISDMAGIDVTAHNNSMRRSIAAIRNWLVTASRRKTIPPGDEIDRRFKQFRLEIKKICKHQGRDYGSMPFVELTRNMSDWLNLNQVVHKPLFGSDA